MTPDEYCEQRALKSGSSFYYAFRFLEPERRRAIVAFYAFCREIDDVVDEIREPAVARTRLGFWRDEIVRLFSRRPTHPITQALMGPVERYDLAAEYFEELLDGMQMDLDYDAYPDFATLSLYCYRVASVVGIVSAQIFGYQDRSTLKYAHDLGLALQLTNILRDVHEDALRGRVYLPLDELEAHGVGAEELRLNLDHARLRELFSSQAERAQGFYRSAMEKLPASDRAQQRAGLIMGAIYRALLDEIAADGYRVLIHRTRLTPLRKLWIGWRVDRAARRGKRIPVLERG